MVINTFSLSYSLSRTKTIGLLIKKGSGLQLKIGHTTTFFCYPCFYQGGDSFHPFLLSAKISRSCDSILGRQDPNRLQRISAPILRNFTHLSILSWVSFYSNVLQAFMINENVMFYPKEVMHPYFACKDSKLLFPNHM